MKGVPTGAFLPGTSLIHRIGAGTKLICLLLLIAAVVSARTVLGYAVMTLSVAAVAALSRLPVKSVVGPARRMVWFFVTIFLMNTLFFGASEPWAVWWIFRPSYAGVMQGVNVVFRVLLALLLGNILTCTTPPMELTAAIERGISPLRFIGVPIAQVAMILSVAIQFIPTLFEETDMIRKAQTARGARFDSRSLADRAAAVLPMVVPIFLAAFRRADELSLAMEARGYRGAKRAKSRRGAPIGWEDVLAVLSAAVLLAAQLTVINNITL